jgi:hypothetical protein
MKLIDFIEKYPDEESCRQRFKELRVKYGVTCKRCNGSNHCWLPLKQQFDCKECGFRTTLRSGTVMECSNLPFRQWFICIHIMSSVKKGISAKEMQRQLGRSRYQPVWEMMHKIRVMMGNQNENSQFTSTSEIEERFFTEWKHHDKDLDIESESIAAGKVTISLDEENSAMRLVQDREHLNNSFSSLAYCTLKTFMETFNRLHDHGSIRKIKPWVLLTIGNIKKIIKGIHHNVNSLYLQNYLDEFCYKFNNRSKRGDPFDRLLTMVTRSTWHVGLYR